MALIITARDSVLASLGIDRSRHVADRALDGYSEVASALPSVWPPTPDEPRVRYYAWASSRIKESRAALISAMDALDGVAFWMNVLAEDLDAFAKTGKVPIIEDADLEGDPIALTVHRRPIDDSHDAVQSAHAGQPSRSWRKSQRAAASSPRRQGQCLNCGITMPHPRPTQLYCSGTCRERHYAQFGYPRSKDLRPQ